MAISRKLLNPDERLLTSTRTHPKALFGPILALVVLLAAGVFVQVIDAPRVVGLIAWVLVGLGILYFSVRPFLSWLTTAHAFTDRRIITRTGIITRRGHDIPLARVSDVAIEIHLLDRLFGCGSLLIAGPSEQGVVRLNDIPNVEQTQRELNVLLHELHSRRGSDGV